VFFQKDRSIGASRPRHRTVHGIEIRKMPVGRYLDVMQRLGGVLADLLDAAFPGQTPGQIIEGLTALTPSQFREVAIRLLGVLPEQALTIVCAILDADLRLVKDRLTPNELLEVWTAFWQMNDLSAFFQNARKALPAALGAKKAAPGGSSA